MKYLIPDLLNNQTLRKELLDKAFCLKDENGVFSGLDFLGSSLRANHRAVFDAIAANGGDAALEQVLSQNNTCLTSDPHAAKQGVVPVRGSNAYFIKTNAGAPLAFQSILTAIWDYANDAEGFDRDGIYLLDEADTDEAEPEAEQTAEEAVNRVCFETAHDYSVVVKDGRSCFYDNNEERFSGVPISTGDAERDKEHPILESAAVLEEEDYGWRYKANAGDDFWGFIAKDFSFATEQQYTQISSQNIWDKNDAVVVLKDGFGHYTIYSEEWHQGLLVLPLPELAQENQPTKVYGFHMEKESDSQYVIQIRHSLVEKEKSDPDEINTFVICVEELGIEQGKFYALCELGTACERWFVNGHCISRTRQMKEVCLSYDTFKAVRHLGDRAFYEKNGYICSGVEEGSLCFYYVVKKDCLWAVVALFVKTDEVRQLTPFAFTDAQGSIYGYCVVEQYGKWGVYDILTHRYVIPCEYEPDITYSHEEQLYTVHKAGFVGRIRRDSTWETHLHREE